MTVDLDIVLAAVNAGICVVPPAEDGTKRPDGDWKRYQENRPDGPQLRAWFDRGRDGMGFICGRVSGGLEMLEFEGRAVEAGTLIAFEEAAQAVGLGELLERIAQGYMEATPSGGIHLLYRCDTPLGNTKLARRPATSSELAENPDDKVKVLIETRGEGGYVIVAPSHGHVHPSGAAWTQIHGGVGTIEAISDSERDALFELARTFDTMPTQQWRPPTPTHRTADGDGPADHYNAATSWLDLLEPAGWKRVYERDRTTYWCRPGKERGISASTNHDGFDLFHVFSSSTVFEPERSYTKFQAYAILNYGGDLSAAGKALYAEGYGQRREPQKTKQEPPRDWEPFEGRAIPNTPDTDTEPAPTAAGAGLLEIQWAREHAHDVDSQPPVGWLIRGIWPADAHGVLAAEQKAGKTWANLDLAISVASGTPWMGVYPCDTKGPVLLFLGEGGKRKMLRRLRAICDHRGVRYEDLPIRVCFRVPHLTSALHLDAIACEVATLRPALVVVDPLYLAARGAKTSQLNEMGEHLENVQHVAMRYGAALAIVHHWNKTGEGKGAKRMTGAGGAEWGRVLVSVSVMTKHTDKTTGTTSVVLEWDFEGDEIPDTSLRVKRRVWSDNPDDLASPMHYELDVVEDDPAEEQEYPGLSPSARRVVVILRTNEGWMTVRELGDDLAEQGHPLKPRTIQTALKDAVEAGLVRPAGDPGTAFKWRFNDGN
jgi:hypothetical protein